MAILVLLVSLLPFSTTPPTTSASPPPSAQPFTPCISDTNKSSEPPLSLLPPLHPPSPTRARHNCLTKKVLSDLFRAGVCRVVFDASNPPRGASHTHIPGGECHVPSGEHLSHRTKLREGDCVLFICSTMGSVYMSHSLGALHDEYACIYLLKWVWMHTTSNCASRAPYPNTDIHAPLTPSNATPMQ